MTESEKTAGLRPSSAEIALTVDSILERRQGFDCAAELREDSAALLLPWNQVIGPRSIAPALLFVSQHQRFRVADLPRLLDDKSRLVLARRLIREGVLKVSSEQGDATSVSLPEKRVTGKVNGSDKKGSLVVVGSGIKSLAQMTVETRAWIDKADVILYLAADPATEVWIQKNYPQSADLGVLYSQYLQRNDVYEAMVEEIMRPVREGKTVCCVFYGHPGVFVTPTHRAIEAARSEGYPARMLAGVSATDCLYADVGFNPSEDGCQSYEATDMMAFGRPLHPENNVIIWQIGLVGNPTSKDDSSKLPILLEYLEQFYDPDCEVVHYQGSVFATCAPVVERLPLRELGKGARVTSMSTLFIPPQKKPQLNPEMMQRLGLFAEPSESEGTQPAEAQELPRYESTPDSSAVADFVLATAEDPELLMRYEEDPEGTSAQWGLEPADVNVLRTRMPGRIWSAIKHGSELKPPAQGAGTPASPAEKQPAAETELAT